MQLPFENVLYKSDNVYKIYSFCSKCYVRQGPAIFRLTRDFGIEKIPAEPIEEVLFVGGGLILFATHEEQVFGIQMVSGEVFQVTKPRLALLKPYKIDQLTVASSIGWKLKQNVLSDVLQNSTHSVQDHTFMVETEMSWFLSSINGIGDVCPGSGTNWCESVANAQSPFTMLKSNTASQQ